MRDDQLEQLFPDRWLAPTRNTASPSDKPSPTTAFKENAPAEPINTEPSNVPSENGLAKPQAKNDPVSIVEPA